MPEESVEAPAVATPEQPSLGPDKDAWRESLPDDLGKSEMFQTMKANTAGEALSEMARMTVSAQKLVGADKVILPGKDATDEDKASFWNKLGRPDQNTGYEMPGELPDGFAPAPEALTAFWEKSHALGLTKQQAAGVLRHYAEVERGAVDQMAQSQKEHAEASVEALRKDWGTAFDERLATAKAAVDRLGGEELKQALVDAGVDNNVALIQAFSKIGKFMAEDQIIGSGKTDFALTPLEASKKIAALEADPEFVKRYTNGHIMGHDSAVKEMSELFEIRASGG